VTLILDVDDAVLVQTAYAVDEAADMIIGILVITGINFRLPRKYTFEVRRLRTPGRDFLWSLGEVAILGITASCFCRANVSSRSLSQP
jgi:hypothetical protein